MTDPETITLRFTLIGGQRVTSWRRRGSSIGSSNGRFQPRCDPVGAGALPVVEAGVMTFRQTLGCPDRSARRGRAV
jgi:hypothetical protein